MNSGLVPEIVTYAVEGSIAVSPVSRHKEDRLHSLLVL